ncbi:MAG TPA: Dabb family protein [Candidatus Hydrogenedentes bacterium]|mgnify:CR=1 FL=1|nr:Dabb family protein [Candidatus Hydrogenedentota bacterium]
MKTYFILACVAAVCISLVAGYNVSLAAAEDGKVLRHVVLFKFKDTAKPEEVAKVEQAFCDLPKKINIIQGFEWGTDVSPEKLSQGFTHCFFLTFKNAADRDAYLIHPAHKEFGSILHPYLDKVLVVDYFAK